MGQQKSHGQLDYWKKNKTRGTEKRGIIVWSHGYRGSVPSAMVLPTSFLTSSLEAALWLFHVD